MDLFIQILEGFILLFMAYIVYQTCKLWLCKLTHTSQIYINGSWFYMGNTKAWKEISNKIIKG